MRQQGSRPMREDGRGPGPAEAVPAGPGLRRRAAALACCAALTCTATAPDARAEGLTMAPSAPPSVAYRWETQRCHDDFIPDSPARAFRRADGKVALVASHYENWMLVGETINSVKPVCQSTLSSTSLPPGRFGRLWIQALYSPDGKDVAALVSEDLTLNTRAAGCVTSASPGECWLNDIRAARSTDMGRTFTLGPLVAALARRYPDGVRDRFGVFTTSNIVRGDDAFYMIAWVQGRTPQEQGNCLFRSDDPLDPASWRGWSGSRFEVAMNGASPAGAADDTLTGAVRCVPVDRRGLPSEVRSLSRFSATGEWIAVFASRQKLPGDQAPVPGFYFATSRDLFTWSTARRIIPAPTKAREEQMDSVWSYPSLLDPDSRSRNFDTIDHDTALLTYTVHHLANGRGTLNRDLVTLPVSIGAR